MLGDGGLPVSGTPVEGLSRQDYENTLVEGYESEGLKIDREMLTRMVEMKKLLYIKFTRQAFIEGNIPADMEPFLKYIVDFCEPKWKIEE